MFVSEDEKMKRFATDQSDHDHTIIQVRVIQLRPDDTNTMKWSPVILTTDLDTSLSLNIKHILDFLDQISMIRLRQ